MHGKQNEIIMDCYVEDSMICIEPMFQVLHGTHAYSLANYYPDGVINGGMGAKVKCDNEVHPTTILR